ncbi:pantoate--beta-alanine ligase [Bacteriovorax stolpii]|uniref:Pantothenate synthetase n=1 Tax=Bacteriovorax stolpii TaxID=960 RepID=A0A2K9NWE9_BACTC|nr:pantoate--beta-alanine ligase [Bacteriovorax stolpii]AUN99385.1 pantoate--beta-alanine ligase [Bacteriovorax stolpii]TDP55073.1 pantothenate synthetase [Bacteriovorax stolpii]
MIKVFTTKKDFDHYRNALKSEKIGLVPTMGNLHKGHISLIEKSTEENDVTIVTIFVNPKQFGPNEDFDKYPRTLDEDLAKISAMALLISAQKEIAVFAPGSNEEIYPQGFSTTISVGPMTQKFEGSVRPTHFDGVTTVVYRLFTITRAHIAYFGQKDVQQCLIIKKMVKDLDIKIKIHIMPIVRNAEGLALSSRNQYLSESERAEALTLPQTLVKIEKLIRTKQDYKTFVSDVLKNDKRWDYLEILDSDNMEAPSAKTQELVIVAAFRSGTTRLLDNILVPVHAG